eukprot:TRINITY_DN22452_c0_g1_i1.p2 TRINITY_DN22452_c0_g1~~TRINITY_DN22452_c0_g1_i1.p2  ORF type:complete len:178 (+),score=22.66 TRINITY_DN22452_c0_g1_i1:605-1138(+)
MAPQTALHCEVHSTPFLIPKRPSRALERLFCFQHQQQLGVVHASERQWFEERVEPFAAAVRTQMRCGVAHGRVITNMLFVRAALHDCLARCCADRRRSRLARTIIFVRTHQPRTLATSCRRRRFKKLMIVDGVPVVSSTAAVLEAVERLAKNIVKREGMSGCVDGGDGCCCWRTFRE